MKFGFIRCCAASPTIKVGDCIYNSKNITEEIKKAYNNNAEIIVFPEIVIT